MFPTRHRLSYATIVVAAAFLSACEETEAKDPPIVSFPAELAQLFADPPQTQLSEIDGLWRVSEVHVFSLEGHYEPMDDSSIVGALLSISSDEIRWIVSNTQSFANVCEEPSIADSDQLICGGIFYSEDEMFVPVGARLTLQDDDRLLFDWYEGMRFTLLRE